MPHAVIRRFSMQCARHGWQSVTQSKAQRQPLADPLAHQITMQQQQQQQQQACVQSSMTTVSHLHTIFTRHLADKRAACAHYILHVCSDARCIPSDWRSQTKSSATAVRQSKFRQLLHNCRNMSYNKSKTKRCSNGVRALEGYRRPTCNKLCASSNYASIVVGVIDKLDRRRVLLTTRSICCMAKFF